jgi:hypothetical protein
MRKRSLYVNTGLAVSSIAVLASCDDHPQVQRVEIFNPKTQQYETVDNDHLSPDQISAYGKDFNSWSAEEQKQREQEAYAAGYQANSNVTWWLWWYMYTSGGYGRSTYVYHTYLPAYTTRTIRTVVPRTTTISRSTTISSGSSISSIKSVNTSGYASTSGSMRGGFGTSLSSSGGE